MMFIRNEYGLWCPNCQERIDELWPVSCDHCGYPDADFDCDQYDGDDDAYPWPASCDRSGEAGETATQIAGSTEGESAVPAKQGDAQTTLAPIPSEEPHP
jgi:hypothetical protein